MFGGWEQDLGCPRLNLFDESIDTVYSISSSRVITEFSRMCEFRPITQGVQSWL